MRDGSALLKPMHGRIGQSRLEIHDGKIRDMRRERHLGGDRDAERQGHLRGLQVDRMLVGEAALNDARNAERDRRDIGGAEAVLKAQRQHAIDSGGDARGGRVRLGKHVHEMEALPEPVLDR